MRRAVSRGLAEGLVLDAAKSGLLEAAGAYEASCARRPDGWEDVVLVYLSLLTRALLALRPAELADEMAAMVADGLEEELQEAREKAAGG